MINIFKLNLCESVRYWRGGRTSELVGGEGQPEDAALVRACDSEPPVDARVCARESDYEASGHEHQVMLIRPYSAGYEAALRAYERFPGRIFRPWSEHVIPNHPSMHGSAKTHQVYEASAHDLGFGVVGSPQACTPQACRVLTPPEPYSRDMPRALWWPQGVELFLKRIRL